MSLNCAEIDKILEELDLEGSYIQKVVQSSYSVMVLHLYKTRPMSLVICLEPGACRLHETTRKIPKFDKPLRFMELLRSRLRGAKITEAVQLNNDRIVRLSLETSSGMLYLYIRLWSGAANMLLVDNGIIVDAFYRRPSRHEVSGEPWQPLPGESEATTTQTFGNEPSAAAGSESKAVAESVSTTVSPIAADKPVKTYTVRSYDASKTFNEAIDEWYARQAPVLSLEALRAEAEHFYGLKIEKISRALEKLEAKKHSFLQADTLKHQGDLLLANLYRIPQGASSVELEDYAADNRIIRIALDPRKTGQENAAGYYERYKKAVSGLEALTDDIEDSKRTLAALNEELAKLRVEENPYLIEKVLHKRKIPVQRKQAAQEKERPGLTFYHDGWILYVGRTATENDELLRHHVRGKDMWLHVRDYSGGYVFIKNKNGKTVPLPVLIAAGNLAVFYSKARRNGQADLYYTAVKDLRRAKNAPKGTVLPSNEKNLSIKLDPAVLKQLEQSRGETLS
ncbi:fibronectin-binding domain-containing protein [Treponema sp. OMZ 305]|uniref:NFACT RNA binding domain-containing protein n=1 Tax=Treponema sp. OMZ 305 TaxID=1659192 RepID=UPI0020A439DE|nr:NFACT family protein [Treponema sp. OMZ 305]UTC58275.1 fibronectin-binding domain-containing protein [Treponema sp. OMZ 305]